MIKQIKAFIAKFSGSIFKYRNVSLTLRIDVEQTQKAAGYFSALMTFIGITMLIYPTQTISSNAIFAWLFIIAGGLGMGEALGVIKRSVAWEVLMSIAILSRPITMYIEYATNQKYYGVSPITIRAIIINTLLWGGLFLLYRAIRRIVIYPLQERQDSIEGIVAKYMSDVDKETEEAKQNVKREA